MSRIIAPLIDAQFDVNFRLCTTLLGTLGRVEIEVQILHLRLTELQGYKLK